MSSSQQQIGVGVLVVRDDSILLGRRLSPMYRDMWGLPGGRKETGATAEDAARRELWEETGLRARIIRCADYDTSLFTSQEHLASNFQFASVFMEAIDVIGTPIVREPTKCAEWQWFKWSALPELLFPPLKKLQMTGFVPSTIDLALPRRLIRGPR